MKNINQKIQNEKYKLQQFRNYKMNYNHNINKITYRNYEVMKLTAGITK